MEQGLEEYGSTGARESGRAGVWGKGGRREAGREGASKAAREGGAHGGIVCAACAQHTMRVVALQATAAHRLHCSPAATT